MKKILLFFVSIALFSCGGDDANKHTSSNAGSMAYFKGSLNGKSFDYFQDNSTNPTPLYLQIFYYGGCYTKTIDCVMNYGSFMTPYDLSSNNKSLIGLYLYHLYNGPNQIDGINEFHNEFSKLSTVFLTSEQFGNEAIKGLSVDYTSPDGREYSTLYGNQSGSLLTITSSIPADYYGNFTKTQTLTGSVNCKLYNLKNPSDFITLTNGQFKLTFAQKNY